MDCVQTLTIVSHGDAVVNGDDEQIVFFGRDATASNTDILTAIGPGSGDPTKAQLETAGYPFISNQNMTVSTAGVGIGNNNLGGGGSKSAIPCRDIGAGNESFVVNPEGDLTSAKVYIDNPVAGHDTNTESLYDTTHTANGTLPVAI